MLKGGKLKKVVGIARIRPSLLSRSAGVGAAIRGEMKLIA